jgi:glycerol kinase
MCFQVNDVLSSMHKDAGEAGEVKSAEGEFLLRVDGGATVNNLLMQIQVKKITSSLSLLACKALIVHNSIYLFRN